MHTACRPDQSHTGSRPGRGILRRKRAPARVCGPPSLAREVVRPPADPRPRASHPLWSSPTDSLESCPPLPLTRRQKQPHPLECPHDPERTPIPPTLRARRLAKLPPARMCRSLGPQSRSGSASPLLGSLWLGSILIVGSSGRALPLTRQGICRSNRILSLSSKRL